MLFKKTCFCVLAVGLLFSGLVHCCFIGECPLEAEFALPVTECMSCMQGRGRCVNSNTCCGAEIGCLSFHRGGSRCSGENRIPVPCRVQGDKKCGPLLDGKCVLNNICCNSVSCRNDEACIVSDYDE